MVKLFVKPIEIQAKHGLMMIYTFATMFIVNALVLLMANTLFPSDIVLGTSSISTFWAVHHSMFKLALICTFVVPLVSLYEWKKNTTFTPSQWMTLYFAVNTIALWIISRFADNLGLGISHWWVVVLFALVLDWVQGMAMMALGKLVK